MDWLGKTPPTDFHIYGRKCLVVLGYFIGITQLLRISQPETVISAVAIFMILAKSLASPGEFREAAPRRGRFAPFASLTAAQRINVARFARSIAKINFY